MKGLLQRDKDVLKNSNLQQKLEFLLDYYKWPAIAVVLTIVIIASFVIPAVTAKDVVLSGILLNSYQSSFENLPVEELAEDILAALGADPEACTAELSTGLIFDPDNKEAAEISYQVAQRIGAQVSIGELDFVVGNYEAMAAFAESGTFYALSEVLRPEELTQYEPWVLEQSDGVLLDVSSCGALMEGYPYLREPLVLAIAVNAPHPEQIPKLLNFLFSSDNEQTN